jgi:hypothetical protein
MTRKADFDAEQWDTLTAAPALAALAISRAERGGGVREAVSLSRTYQEARARARTPLVEALLASPPALGGAAAQADASDLLDRARDAVGRASALLRERATEAELREWGDFVVELTEAVARAHREGGVLGFGGTEVSEAERAALEAIALALGPRPGSGDGAA